MAAALETVYQCDFGRANKAPDQACDLMYEDNFPECEGPNFFGPGLVDHPYRLCFVCWQRIINDPPVGRGFGQVAQDIVDQLIYVKAGPAANDPWVLRNTVTMNGLGDFLATTQALLCTHCADEEVAQWRRCEADQAYADALLEGKSQWVADGHTNTCICYRKLILHPHQCEDCLERMVAGRRIIATHNNIWLMQVGRSNRGERRTLSEEGQEERRDNDSGVPCRCGRDVDREALAPALRASFCLACNGTKIWPQNITESRFPVRTSRATLIDPASKYPLEYGPDPFQYKEIKLGRSIISRSYD